MYSAEKNSLAWLLTWSLHTLLMRIVIISDFFSVIVDEMSFSLLYKDDRDDCDPDKLLQCPFDKNHQIRACRFPYHLIKCRKVSWCCIENAWMKLDYPPSYFFFLWCTLIAVPNYHFSAFIYQWSAFRGLHHVQTAGLSEGSVCLLSQCSSRLVYYK